MLESLFIILKIWGTLCVICVRLNQNLTLFSRKQMFRRPTDKCLCIRYGRSNRSLPWGPIITLIDEMSLEDEHSNVSLMHSCLLSYAVMKLLIIFLYIYVDDSFSAQCKGEILFYKNYQKMLPSNPIRLFSLWDFLGIPHEGKKQVLVICSLSSGLRLIRTG